ncbi:MAG TPA: glycosyltransferase family 1 protein [Sphingobacteriaceae bacterium]|nr:glycosyltransferase family 1 protein [Sphingobacteriaceae bacterium]
MRIGIDYRFAVRSSRGIATYIREIVRELMLIDQANEYILYIDEDTALNLPANFSKAILPYKNILLFEQIYLPLQARSDRLDILWYPSNSGPIFLHHTIKLVVTVHDLISFMNFNSVNKWSFSSLKYRSGEYYRKYALKSGLNRINQMITVSEYSGSRIRQLLKRDAAVIYNNISSEIPSGADQAILERLSLIPGGYLFSITGHAPHKNLKGLLEAISGSSLSEKLVISGIHNKNVLDEYPEEIRRKVIITGYITEEEKACLYKNSKAFLFLSHYEGFGIPVLEAMQFNIPVIASNRSSIPEVVGNGGQLIDPEDIEGIRRLIRELPQVDIEELRTRQAEQLKKFSSWRNSAVQLLQLFAKLNPDLKYRN